MLVLTIRYLTLGFGAPRLTNLLEVCQGVWQGGKSILWPAACNVQLVHMMKCGIALLLPTSPLSGDKCSDCDTKTRSVICTFRNVISL